MDLGDITEAEARTHPKRNYITRALGPEESALCDGFIVPMERGDFILLCTDGLVETVTDQEMYEEVRAARTWTSASSACWRSPSATARRTM